MGIWTGSKDVFIQDQTSPLFQYFMIDELKTDITLTAPVAIDDEIINVSAGHGFIVGNVLTIFEASRFEQVDVVAVNTNAITISIPVAAAFTIANAIIIRGSKQANIDASGTPKTFYYKPRNSIIPVDLSIGRMIIESLLQPDDSKFGGIAALTNGIYFRRVDGARVNYGNYKCNSDFRAFGGGVQYIQKAGGGSWFTIITVQIKPTYGQVTRVNPRNNDYIAMHLRDKLDGLDNIHVSWLGSFTEGE